MMRTLQSIVLNFSALALQTLSFSLILIVSTTALAETIPDRYPESLLYDKPVKVADNVWSAIGQTQYYSYENAGHNNNLSFVIGNDAVLVVNGSASYLLAKALHDEIKQLTDKPVKYVVDENGQSHASLGNSYWKEQGATLIAHTDAAKEIQAHGLEGIASLQNILKERAEGTALVPIDQTFEDNMTLDLGGITAELIRFGPAHSPGDISVFIPERNLLIAGDIAFHVRLLPIFPDTDTAAWLDTWHSTFSKFAYGKIIVPGHGGPTDFATIDLWTRGYLEFIRGKVGELIDQGGTLADAYQIDQSPYAHLATFEELATKNAGRVFQAMEFE
jgi:glyoxylase-like metal-dependent hydrolase (beta-lactamase superfamily II)